MTIPEIPSNILNGRNVQIIFAEFLSQMYKSKAMGKCCQARDSVPGPGQSSFIDLVLSEI